MTTETATAAPELLDENGLTVIERLIVVLKDTLCIDEAHVTPDAALVADLEADSLDLLEINMAIEDEFGVEIADNELSTVNSSTVQQVADLVTRRLGEVAVRP